MMFLEVMAQMQAVRFEIDYRVIFQSHIPSQSLIDRLHATVILTRAYKKKAFTSNSSAAAAPLITKSKP